MPSRVQLAQLVSESLCARALPLGTDADTTIGLITHAERRLLWAAGGRWFGNLWHGVARWRPLIKFNQLPMPEPSGLEAMDVVGFIVSRVGLALNTSGVTQKRGSLTSARFGNFGQAPVSTSVVCRYIDTALRLLLRKG